VIFFLCKLEERSGAVTGKLGFKWGTSFQIYEAKQNLSFS